MGQSGIYECLSCGKEFPSEEGGGFYFSLYRCIDCDTTKSIPIGNRIKQIEKIGPCTKCGGKLLQNLTPMCPNCHKRNAVIKQLLSNYD